MTPDLSVVIPVRNEAASLAELHGELTATLVGWGRPYEILIIDDGSTDGSFDRLVALCAREPRLRIVRLARNFGQTAAIAAGIDHSHGAIIILLDADLQNDPADIPMLLAKLDEGYDLVSGWRKDRQDSRITRTIPSNLAKPVVEQLRTQVLSGLEQIELQIRRKLDDQNVGQVRSGAPNRVPPGYAESVAEYFRRLSQGK